MLNLAENATINQKVKDLCQALVDNEEFQSIQHIIHKFLGDDAAKAQYQEFMQKNENFHQRHHSGEEITPDDIDEFETLKTALFKNPLIEAFLTARESVGQLQKMVQDNVAITFEHGRIPVAEDFTSGCCQQGGCGCADKETTQH